MRKASDKLLTRIEELENQLAESEQLIDAIKAGEVDAFAISSETGSEVYTLQSGDYAYRILIEEFGEGAVNLTNDGLIVYSNKYFFQLLGLSYERVVGSSVFDFIHPDSLREFTLLFNGAKAGKSKGEITLAVEGRIVPVYISLTSLAPRLDAVGVIITDLTQQKAIGEERIQNEKTLAEKNNELLSINRQLNETQHFLNNVLESTNHGVLSYVAVRADDEITDFEIRYANDIAIDQIGLPKHKVIGQRYLTVLPMARESGVFDIILRVMSTRISETHELNSPSDPQRWFMVRYSPLDDGVTTTYVEITEQKRQAKSMQDKNIELERSNAELASFSYVASHDLQEPLRKIQTFSNRILDKEAASFTPKTRDYFERIIAATARMKDLITALLNYSRTETSDILLVQTDLNTVLEDVRLTLREVMDDTGTTIRNTGLPTLNVIPHQFNQLFLNIIGNAIKYRKPDVTPVITISAEIVPATSLAEETGVIRNYWKIVVADNGLGFELQYADRIFELFQRLYSKSEYEGTGIGLSICKKIVQNHGGFIKATAQPDAGAVFTIFIPVKE